MDMADRIAEFSIVIDILSTRPAMVVEDHSYTGICNYLLGYMDGLFPMQSQESLGLKFTYWVQAQYGRKASVRWPSYIKHIWAAEDEKHAREILFSQLRSFIASLQVEISKRAGGA